MIGGDDRVGVGGVAKSGEDGSGTGRVSEEGGGRVGERECGAGSRARECESGREVCCGEERERICSHS